MAVKVKRTLVADVPSKVLKKDIAAFTKIGTSKGLKEIVEPVEEQVAAVPEMPSVKYVTCDVDGTILNTKHNVDPRVERAIIETLRSGVKFVCASGKSRQGVLNSVGAKIEASIRKAYGGVVPGVYLNGLIVYGLEGELVFEKAMPVDVCWKIINKARELNVTLVAYNEDRILCEKYDSETEKLRPYKEPHPEEIGTWESVVGKVSLHKFMYLAPVDVCKEIRPGLEKMVANDATLTQAIPDMIEVLPGKGSKGAGVQMFLDSFNGQPKNLMALGDAENDLEMIALARYGIAMGNGADTVKAVAKDVTATNDNAGVAVALKKYVLNVRTTVSTNAPVTNDHCVPTRHEVTA